MITTIMIKKRIYNSRSTIIQMKWHPRICQPSMKMLENETLGIELPIRTRRLIMRSSTRIVWLPAIRITGNNRECLSTARRRRNLLATHRKSQQPIFKYISFPKHYKYNIIPCIDQIIKNKNKFNICKIIILTFSDPIDSVVEKMAKTLYIQFI